MLPGTPPHPDIPLEARHLECIRGERLLFRELSFRLPTGTLLHVEGPNGAGKSSLLRILAGLSLPESGEVYWHGCRIGRDRAEFAGFLNYVGHRSGLKGELDPVENLKLASRLHGSNGLLPEEALQRLDLGACIDLPCRRLSAGQQRRVALARLLINPAPTWILDEPYTALDTAGIRLVDNLLASHLDTGGTVVLSSHQHVGATTKNLLRIRLGHA